MNEIEISRPTEGDLDGTQPLLEHVCRLPQLFPRPAIQVVLAMLVGTCGCVPKSLGSITLEPPRTALRGFSKASPTNTSLKAHF